MAFRPKPVVPPAPVTGGDATDPQIDPNTGLNVDPSVKSTKYPVGTTPRSPDATTTTNDAAAPPIDLTGDIIMPGQDPLAGAAGTYDPKNPAAFINYHMQAKFGRNATPDEIAYWTGKLSSQEETGTIDPATGKYKIADPAYWATRIRKEGVDDVNPPKSSRGYLDAANQFGGLFGGGGLSGFLGTSLVPTDAASNATLMQRIKDILAGGGGLDTKNLSAGADAGTPGGGDAGGGSASAEPVGAPAPAVQTNANPATPSYGFTGGSTGTPAPTGTSNRPSDTAMLGSLLERGNSNNPLSSASANAGATRIPDRAASGIASFFGLEPILAAGNQLQRLNHPGDIIFGNPPGGPQGPTDPNLRPTDPEEQQRNAAIVAALLANNEANGGR